VSFYSSGRFFSNYIYHLYGDTPSGGAKIVVLGMFSHTKKILNIFAFLSHRILFNISGGILHLFPGRPSEFDAWPLHPTFFYHFAWSCMHRSHRTAGHVHAVFFVAPFFCTVAPFFFLWRFLFCTMAPFFPTAFSLLPI
jgi:hypothetical protein